MTLSEKLFVGSLIVLIVNLFVPVIVVFFVSALVFLITGFKLGIFLGKGIPEES